MSQPAQQGDTRFLGFAADGSKLYADRCTYCLREGHRASHCPSRRPADFAALTEPDCAHYCKGECDPMGATCFKGHKPGQIVCVEPESLEGRAVGLAQWLIGAVVLGAVVAVVGKAAGAW